MKAPEMKNSFHGGLGKPGKRIICWGLRVEEGSVMGLSL
jgi:hypothetical protein